VHGKQAWVLGLMGRGDQAESEALMALGLWADNTDSRLVLAERRLAQGRFDTADSFAVAQLTLLPNDGDALRVRERIHAARLGR